jgi:hypothetical protein
MRVMVVVKPRFFIPMEQFPQLIQGFVDWRARHREHMEVFEFFAGSAGGFGIINIDNEAALNLMFIEYPFSPYSEIEFRPILDGDAALRQWQQAMDAMQGQGATSG